MKRKIFFSALATALLSVMLSASVFAGTADAEAKKEHAVLDWTTDKAAEITNAVYANGNAAVAKETAAAIKTAEQAMADAGKVQTAQMAADSEKKLVDFGLSQAKKQQDAINDLNKKAAEQAATAQKIQAIKNATAQKIAEAAAKQAQAEAALVDPANNTAAAYKAAADAACAQFEAQNAANQVIIQKAYENKIACINATCKQLQDQYIATADALNAYNKAVVDNRVANIVADAQNTVNNYALANAAYQHSTVASITTLLAKRPQAITNSDFAIALSQQIERAEAADKTVAKESANLATARAFAAATAAPIAPLGQVADANIAALNNLKKAYPANVEAYIKANDDAVKAARAEAEKAGAVMITAVANAATADTAAFNQRVLAKSSAVLADAYGKAYLTTLDRHAKFNDACINTYKMLLENRVKLANDANAFAAAHGANTAAAVKAADAAKAAAAQSFAKAALQHAVMQATKDAYAVSLANTYSNSVAAITAQSIITAAAYDKAALENAKNAYDIAFAAAVSVPNAQALLAEHINRYFTKVYAARV